MSGQNKKASLVWDQKNLLMNLGMEDTHLSVGVDISLRPHTLVVKSLYTSSLRSDTLVSEGLIHCQHQVPYTSW